MSDLPQLVRTMVSLLNGPSNGSRQERVRATRCSPQDGGYLAVEIKVEDASSLWDKTLPWPATTVIMMELVRGHVPSSAQADDGRQWYFNGKGLTVFDEVLSLMHALQRSDERGFRYYYHVVALDGLIATLTVYYGVHYDPPYRVATAIVDQETGHIKSFELVDYPETKDSEL